MNTDREKKEAYSQHMADPDVQLQVGEQAANFSSGSVSSYMLNTLVRGAMVVVILGAIVLIMRRRVFMFNRWVYLVCMLLVLPPAIVPFKLGVSRPALYDRAADTVRVNEGWLNPVMLAASIGRGDDVANAEERRSPREQLSDDQKAALILSLSVDWALVFYLGVMGLFLLRQLQRYCRWGLAVRRLRRLDDERAVAVFREACGVCALKPERVKLLAGVGRMTGPASFNFFGGGVIISADAARTLADDELKMVFLHELTHIKNRDQYMVGVASLINIAQWYNPFMYTLRRRFCAALEFECDARVMRLVAADKEAKGRYARMLLAFYRGGGASCVVGLSMNARELERRIKGIFSAGSRRRYRAWLSAAAIIMVVAAGGLFAGMERRELDLRFAKYALDDDNLVYARITAESFAPVQLNGEFERMLGAIKRAAPISLIVSGESTVFYIPALKGLDEFKEFYEAVQIKPLIDCSKTTIFGHQVVSVCGEERFRDREYSLAIVNPEPHVFVVIPEVAAPTYLRGEYRALSPKMLDALSSAYADDHVIFLARDQIYAVKLLSANKMRIRDSGNINWKAEAVRGITSGDRTYWFGNYGVGDDFVIEGVTVEDGIATNVNGRIIRLMNNGFAFSD